MPSILRYDSVWESLGEMLVIMRSLRPLKYCSIRKRLLVEATIFVVMVTLFQEVQMQLTLTFNLYDLSKLLIRATCSLVWLSILSLSFSLSEMRTCFLKRPLVVICILGLTVFLLC